METEPRIAARTRITLAANGDTDCPVWLKSPDDPF
jgi:hypothetical protein